MGVCLYFSLATPQANRVLSASYHISILDHPRVYHIFAHYKITGMNLGGGGNIIETKYPFLVFYTSFVQNIPYCKEISAGYYHKCI
jgi:hypothetical protein